MEVKLLSTNPGYGPSRALTSMRTFCYPTLFGLDVMVVTCYSLPLLQYVKMGYSVQHVASHCFSSFMGGTIVISAKGQRLTLSSPRKLDDK